MTVVDKFKMYFRVKTNRIHQWAEIWTMRKMEE